MTLSVFSNSNNIDKTLFKGFLSMVIVSILLSIFFDNYIPLILPLLGLGVGLI
jgi:hypothetical protein